MEIRHYYFVILLNKEVLYTKTTCHNYKILILFKIMQNRVFILNQFLYIINVSKRMKFLYRMGI